MDSFFMWSIPIRSNDSFAIERLSLFHTGQSDVVPGPHQGFFEFISFALSVNENIVKTPTYPSMRVS